MQPYRPVDLPTVGSLVAGLTVGMGSLCPRAGILSWWISSCTFGWSHPCPWPVFLPGEREMHQIGTDGGRRGDYSQYSIIVMLWTKYGWKTNANDDIDLLTTLLSMQNYQRLI